MGPLVVLDLYVRNPATLTRLSRSDLQDIARATTEELALTVTGPEFPDDGNSWLDGPDAQRRANVWQDMGLVSIAFGLEAADAVATMRASAIAAGRVVDDVAEDIVAGRLVPADLRAAPDRDGDAG